MRKNLDHAPEPRCPVGLAAPPATGTFPDRLRVANARSASPRGDDPAPAQRLRALVGEFSRRLADGQQAVHLPASLDGVVSRGPGHFHLAPELFLQAEGWTRFYFPQGEHLLQAGQALLLPPRLRHSERVGSTARRRPFCNVVVYAEGEGLSCHLAQEVQAGKPGIAHLEARQHPQAGPIHGWLSDAVRFGHDAAGSPWAAAQLRALVAGAVAGVLRVLDEPEPAGEVAAAEPALVARTRVLVRNQLGDPGLSVRRLAEQSGCSADYLSHVFARATGERLAGWIVRQRLERARRLLADSALAGKEIAWACGFAAPSYFSRSFRTQFGVTPQVWRAQRRQAGDGR